MFLPALQHDATGPGSPAADGHRDVQVMAGAQSADSTTRRVHDERRLRRVKDSREQLKSRTRARGASSGTIDTLTSNSTAGRSYTVANVYGGRLYLRYVGLFPPSSMFYLHIWCAKLHDQEGTNLRRAGTDFRRTLSGRSD